MPIITDLTPPATAEGLILGTSSTSPLDLGNGGSLQLSAFSFPPPPKLPTWATNGDSDGAALVRIPYHDKRTGSFQVRCMGNSTMDQAVNAIKLLQDKLQEACALGAGGGDGLPCLWTPSHATTGLTFFVLLAEVTDLPITYSDGWFAQHPILTVNFTAKPFLYGDEVTGPTATGTDPLLTLEIPDVPGDVPAEARLVITDGSSQARRWCEWGAESRWYDAASPSDLFIDSADLTTSGFAGAGTVFSGAYGGSAISTTLLAQPVAFCGTGNLAHIGTFRVKARVWAASTSEYWRLAWHEGDGWVGANPQVQPVAGSAFNELDLGEITIDEAQAGTQAWSGRIEAWTSAVGGELAAVDYLEFFPTEQYGRLEGTYAYSPGVISGHDEFTSTTAGTALNGRTAPAGGSWATSGATTDFKFADNDFGSGSEELVRTVGSDTGYRFAILGSASFADVEVGVEIAILGLDSPPDLALVARWTDANNHLRLRFHESVGVSSFLVLERVVSGTTTTIATSASIAPLSDAHAVQLRLVAFASGRLLGWLLDTNGNTMLSLEAIDPVLATGGTLATGKPGLADQVTGSHPPARAYDNFYVAIPPSEPVIVNSGQSLEITSSENRRWSSDGSTYGDIPSRGSRLFIPQAGDANRTTRIAVRATREDPITSASRNDADPLTIASFYAPRYLAVPRS